MKFSIVTKIITLTVVLVLVTAGTVGVVLYRGSNTVLVKHELESLGEELHLQRGRIVSTVEALRHDVQFLGRTPPIRGIVRAGRAGGVDPLDGSTEALWRQRLETIFTEFLEAKPAYFQLSYIGLTDGEREWVRVERLDDAIVTETGETLQAEGTGSYLQEAVRLGPDEVYLSHIALARKGGRPVEPHLPVLRAAAPVYSAKGEVVGVVVITMDFSSMLKKSTYKRHAYYYVTNAAGDFLAHPGAGMAFGFDLGKRHRVQETYPELAGMFDPGSREEEMVHFISTERSQGVCFLKVAFDPLHPERFFGLAQAAPYAEVLAESLRVRDRSLALTLLLMAGGIVLAFFLSCRLTRPLDQITRAAENFARGVSTDSLPVKSRDEVGILARAFQHMIQQVRERDRVLQESEARIKAIVDTAPDGIITIDERGIVESCNQAAQRIFGYEPDEVIGQNVRLLMPSPQREEHDGYITNYLDTGAKKIIGIGREVIGQRRDGTPVPLDLIVDEVLLGDRRVFTGILRDITQRKQAEEALRKSEERFRKIFVHSNDAIFVIDPSRDDILDVNPRACSMLGYSREELLSLSISVIHPDEMPKLMSFAESVFEQGQGWTDELTCRTKHSQVLPAEISASAIDLGGRSCLISLVRDITERKQAEEAQRETERVRVLVETAGAAAHEINQPLTVSMGLAQLMLNDTAPDDPRRGNMESIFQMGQKISEIVRKMRDIQQYATMPYVGKTNIVDFGASSQKNRQGK